LTFEWKNLFVVSIFPNIKFKINKITLLDENNAIGNVVIVDKNSNSNHDEVISEQERLTIKVTFDKRIEGKPSSEVKITDSFYNKIEPAYMNLESTKVLNVKNTTAKKLLYAFFRPPIIAMFVGFVVGFITPIRTWLLRTDTSVFVILLSLNHFFPF